MRHISEIIKEKEEQMQRDLRDPEGVIADEINQDHANENNI